jgi:hypothetical protein
MTVAATGIVILLIAVIGAAFWARRPAPDRPRTAATLVFFLYFWLLVFIQLIVVAIGYTVLT